MKRHVENYVRGSRILDMARAMNYPPYHVARLIVENVANLTTGSSGEGGRNPAGSASSSGNKKAVTGAMREPQRVLGDPSILKPEYRSSEENGSSSSPPISRLATEVIEAMRSDPLYGPKQDRERQSVGLEHEEMLEKALEAMGESVLEMIQSTRIEILLQTKPPIFIIFLTYLPKIAYWYPFFTPQTFHLKQRMTCE